MVHGKKPPVRIGTARNYEKELQALYARRYAIDHLIDSLESYERGRVVRQLVSISQQRRSA